MIAILHRVQLSGPRDRTVALERRRLTGGAASLCVALLVAACGSSSSPTTGTSPPSERPSFGPVATFAGSPSDRLTAALTALQGGYTFETTARVGEQVAAHVAGRRLGDASELVIESGGASVTYRIIPPGAWLMEGDGEWVEAENAGAATSGDPLAPLLAPVSVEAATGSSGVDELTATYPAAALGLTGGDPVTVSISIAPGGAVTVRYEIVTDTSPGVSETVLTPAPSQDPILAPSPLPSPGG